MSFSFGHALKLTVLMSILAQTSAMAGAKKEGKVMVAILKETRHNLEVRCPREESSVHPKKERFQEINSDNGVYYYFISDAGDYSTRYCWMRWWVEGNDGVCGQGIFAMYSGKIAKRCNATEYKAIKLSCLWHLTETEVFLDEGIHEKSLKKIRYPWYDVADDESDDESDEDVDGDEQRRRHSRCQLLR